MPAYAPIDPRVLEIQRQMESAGDPGALGVRTPATSQYPNQMAGGPAQSMPEVAKWVVSENPDLAAKYPGLLGEGPGQDPDIVSFALAQDEEMAKDIQERYMQMLAAGRGGDLHAAAMDYRGRGYENGVQPAKAYADELMARAAAPPGGGGRVGPPPMSPP